MGNLQNSPMERNCMGRCNLGGDFMSKRDPNIIAGIQVQMDALEVLISLLETQIETKSESIQNEHNQLHQYVSQREYEISQQNIALHSLVEQQASFRQAWLHLDQSIQVLENE